MPSGPIRREQEFQKILNRIFRLNPAAQRIAQYEETLGELRYLFNSGFDIESLGKEVFGRGWGSARSGVLTDFRNRVRNLAASRGYGVAPLRAPTGEGGDPFIKASNTPRKKTSKKLRYSRRDINTGLEEANAPLAEVQEQILRKGYTRKVRGSVASPLDDLDSLLRWYARGLEPMIDETTMRRPAMRGRQLSEMLPRARAIAGTSRNGRPSFTDKLIAIIDHMTADELTALGEAGGEIAYKKPGEDFVRRLSRSELIEQLMNEGLDSLAILRQHSQEKRLQIDEEISLLQQELLDLEDQRLQPRIGKRASDRIREIRKILIPKLRKKRNKIGYSLSESAKKSTLESLYRTFMGDRFDEEVFDRYKFPQETIIEDDIPGLSEQYLGFRGRMRAYAQGLFPITSGEEIRYRNTQTGRYVSKEFAEANPDITESFIIKTKDQVKRISELIFHREYGTSRVVANLAAGQTFDPRTGEIVDVGRVLDESVGTYAGLQSTAYPRLIIRPQLLPEDHIAAIGLKLGDGGLSSVDATPFSVLTHHQYQFLRREQRADKKLAFEAKLRGASADAFDTEMGQISAAIRRTITSGEVYERNQPVIAQAIRQGLRQGDKTLLTQMGIDVSNLPAVEDIAGEIIAGLLYGDPRSKTGTGSNIVGGIDITKRVGWGNLRRRFRESNSPFAQALTEIIDAQIAPVEGQTIYAARKTFADNAAIPRSRDELRKRVNQRIASSQEYESAMIDIYAGRGPIEGFGDASGAKVTSFADETFQKAVGTEDPFRLAFNRFIHFDVHDGQFPQMLQNGGVYSAISPTRAAQLKRLSDERAKLIELATQYTDHTTMAQEIFAQQKEIRPELLEILSTSENQGRLTRLNLTAEEYLNTRHMLNDVRRPVLVNDQFEIIRQIEADLAQHKVFFSHQEFLKKYGYENWTISEFNGRRLTELKKIKERQKEIEAIFMENPVFRSLLSEEKKGLRLAAQEETGTVVRNFRRPVKNPQQMVRSILGLGEDTIIGRRGEIVQELQRAADEGRYLTMTLPGVGTGAHAKPLQVSFSFSLNNLHGVTSELLSPDRGNLPATIRIVDDHLEKALTRMLVLNGMNEEEAQQEALRRIRLGIGQAQGIEFGLYSATAPDPGRVANQQLIDRFNEVLENRKLLVESWAADAERIDLRASDPQVAAKIFNSHVRDIRKRRIGRSNSQVLKEAREEGLSEAEARARVRFSKQNRLIELAPEIELDALLATQRSMSLLQRMSSGGDQIFRLGFSIPTAASDKAVDLRYDGGLVEVLELAAQRGPNNATVARHRENMSILQHALSSDARGTITRRGTAAYHFRAAGFDGSTLPASEYQPVIDQLREAIARKAGDRGSVLAEMDPEQIWGFLEDLTRDMGTVELTGTQVTNSLLNQINPHSTRVFQRATENGMEYLGQIFPIIEEGRSWFPKRFAGGQRRVRFTGPLHSDTRIFLRNAGLPSGQAPMPEWVDGLRRARGEVNTSQMVSIGEAISQAVAIHRMTPQERAQWKLTGKSEEVIQDVAGGIVDYVSLLMDQQIYGSLPEEAQQAIAGAARKRGVRDLPDYFPTTPSPRPSAGPGPRGGPSSRRAPRGAAGPADEVIEETAQAVEKSFDPVDAGKVFEYIKGSPFLKGAGITIGALGALGLIRAVTHRKDHTPEDARGPAYLPGGSPYDMPNRPQRLGPPSIPPGSNPQLGMTYQVRARGGFEASKLQQALAFLTGGSVAGTIYNVPRPLSQDDQNQQINDIIQNYK